MLLFIHKRNLFPRNRQEFQYISCYCLSAVAVPCIAVGPDFNTSHVTVYLQATNYQTACDLFQYISCYCLSHHPSRCSRLYNHFNTSHVTVYHIRNTRDDMNLLNFNTSHVTVYLSPPCIQFMLCIFQYISCYCLSVALSQAMIDAIKFQYISCYCLSVEWCRTLTIEYISIHLMLLFIRIGKSRATIYR